MKILQILVFLICGTVIAQDADLSYVKIDSLDWVLGKWKRVASSTITYETWEKLDDTYFEGHSERISRYRKDTLFTEALKLVKIGQEIYYVALVEENNQPVHFKLVEIDSAKAIFENPEHDFPQRIKYEILKNGKLKATVGELDEKSKKGFFMIFRKIE